MGSLRARITVEHIPYVGVADTDYNTTTDTWGDPVPVKVFGINFPSTAEPGEVGPNRLIVDAVLLVPPNFVAINAKDRFKLPDYPTDTFEVVGGVEDGSGNPMPSRWNPGGRLKLVRISG